MKNTYYRSITVNLKEPLFYEVVDSVMLMSKNISNPTLFLIKNVLTSYTYQKELKKYILNKEFKPNQKEVIGLFNEKIKELNQVWLDKFNTKKTLQLNSQALKDITEVIEKEKVVKQLPFLTNELDPNDLRSIVLNKTLVEHVLKLKEQNNPEFQNYYQIHSVVAQYAVHQTIDNVANYFKSVVAYWKNFNSKDKTNPPQLPRYLDKNERFTLELHENRFTDGKTLFKVFPKHNLYTNFHDPENSKVSTQAIEFFNHYDLKSNLIKAIDNRLERKNKLSKKLNNQKTTVNHVNSEETKLNQNFNTQYSLQTVRFIPHRKTYKGKNQYPLKVECVIQIEKEIDENLPLAKVLNYYENNNTNLKEKEDNESKIKTNKIITQKPFFELTQEQQDKVVLNYIKHIQEKEDGKELRLAGGDLGINNLFTLALSHGKNQIYSGQYINQVLTKMNQNLDYLKTQVFESMLSKDLLIKVKYNQEVAEILSFDFVNNPNLWDKQKAIKEQFINKYNINNTNIKIEKLELSIEEAKEIKNANKKVYQNLNYVEILVQMENFKKQVLHQLSSDIISHCVKNKIEFLILGYNKGWKQDVDLDFNFNRLFTTIPHYQLVELIKYKAIEHGLIVITTEESFTSQASFIHHDSLPVLQKNKNSNEKIGEVLGNSYEKELDKKETKLTLMDIDNNQSHQNSFNINNKKEKVLKELINKNQFSGERKQHIYRLNKKSNLSPLRFIHADINGGFNIIRKIFKDFSYHHHIDLSYDVRGISFNKTSSLGKRKTVFFSKLKKNICVNQTH